MVASGNVYQLSFVDHVCDSARKHAIGCGKHIESLPQQHDLAIGSDAVTEETLMHILPEIPDF